MTRKLGIALLLGACAASVNAAELKPETLKAWDAYIQTAEARLKSNAVQHVLWIDHDPTLREQVRNGESVALPTTGKYSRPVPHGAIHDWIGAIFIPNVTLDQVFSVIGDYDRYPDYFAPGIRSARTLSRRPDGNSFEVQYVQKVVLKTVVVDAVYEANDCRLDANHWYSIAHSVSLRQVQNEDDPDERELPSDDAKGYVWRMYTLAQFEAADGGVYIEQESLALSRDIPAGLHWIVEPVVERVSRGLITGWLEKTRHAVLASAQRNDVADAGAVSGKAGGIQAAEIGAALASRNVVGRSSAQN